MARSGLLTPRTHRRHWTRAGLALAATAVLAAVPFLTAATTAGSQYVALGDSYSSGLGAGSYGSSGSCYRSADAYPRLWANAHPSDSFAFVACAGATTTDVISSQLSALGPGTSLVSITIGGNDVGFATVMETCVLGSTSDCVNAVDHAEYLAKTQLPGKLSTLFTDIRSDAPNARVVVLGYPDFYDLSHSQYCIGLSTTDRTDLNNGANVLDSVISTAAGQAGFHYADVRSAFSGHEICDWNSWLHSVDWTFLEASYHPTSNGQADAYYPVFASAAG